MLQSNYRGHGCVYECRHGVNITVQLDIEAIDSQPSNKVRMMR